MQAQFSGGAEHFPSWKFPCACATDMTIGSLLDRYAFISPDPRHAVVAKAALLETLIDRMLLLSNITLHRCQAPGTGKPQYSQKVQRAVDCLFAGRHVLRTARKLAERLLHTCRPACTFGARLHACTPARLPTCSCFHVRFHTR